MKYRVAAILTQFPAILYYESLPGCWYNVTESKSAALWRDASWWIRIIKFIPLLFIICYRIPFMCVDGRCIQAYHEWRSWSLFISIKRYPIGPYICEGFFLPGSPQPYVCTCSFPVASIFIDLPLESSFWPEIHSSILYLCSVSISAFQSLSFLKGIFQPVWSGILFQSPRPIWDSKLCK